MTEPPHSDLESSDPPDDDRPPPRPEPSFWETMKWALVMLGITGLIAAITIPILLWLDLA